MKQELLNQITQEISSSNNPQQQALQLVVNANQAKNKYDKALKQPMTSMADRDTSNKRVSFADPRSASLALITQKTTKLSPPITQQDPESTIQQLGKQQISNVSKSDNKNVKCVKKTQPKTKMKQEYAQAAQVSQIVQPSILTPQREYTSMEDDEQDKEMIHKHKHCKHSHQHRKENESLLMTQLQEHIQTIRKLDMNQKFLQQNLQVAEQENKRLSEDIELINNQYLNEDRQRSNQQQLMRQENYSFKEQIQNMSLQMVEMSHNDSFLKKQSEALLSQIQQLHRKELEQDENYVKLRYLSDQSKLMIMDKEGQCARFQQQIEYLTQDVNLFQQQSKDANNEVRQLISQNTQIENDKIKLQSEASILRQDKNESVHVLQEKIIQLRTELDTIHQDYKRESLQMVDVKRERDQWKQDCDILKVNLMESEELRKRLKLRDAENEQLQSDNDKLKWKIRKDPNGILSDLKNTIIQVHENKVQQPIRDHKEQPIREQDMLRELQKLDRENRKLQEDHDKIRLENSSLIQQLVQSDVYVGELKGIMAQERALFEQEQRQNQSQSAYVNQPQAATSSPLRAKDQNQIYKVAERGYTMQVDERPFSQRRVHFQDHPQSSPYDLPTLNHKYK